MALQLAPQCCCDCCLSAAFPDPIVATVSGVVDFDCDCSGMNGDFLFDCTNSNAVIVNMCIHGAPDFLWRACRRTYSGNLNDCSSPGGGGSDLVRYGFDHGTRLSNGNYVVLFEINYNGGTRGLLMVKQSATPIELPITFTYADAVAHYKAEGGQTCLDDVPADDIACDVTGISVVVDEPV